MRLAGKKIGVLVEGDWYEKEILYYQLRFAEEGADLRLLSRLWGQPQLTFHGHEWKVPLECRESFEGLSDAELGSYAALIVPAGMVADRLRYTDDPKVLPPASALMKRAFQNPGILKGIICHGMWLMAPVVEVVRGRRAVVHNNLLGDARAYGLELVDEDVVVDGDLVTARTGGHCHLFARRIIELLAGRDERAGA